MKILIVYASAGLGHQKSAEAIYNAFKQRLKNSRKNSVRLINILDCSNKLFKYLYPRIYLILIKYLPSLWGLFYYAFNNRSIYFFVKPFRRLNNYLNCKKFVQFLDKEDFDVVISTQFLATEIISELKRKRLLKVILITAITDFRSHTFWEDREIDIFVAASKYTKEDLIARDIPARRIKILGIPIAHPLKNYNQALLREEMGLEQARFTILFTSGEFSVGPLKHLIYQLAQLDEAVKNRLQLIIVCAKNKKLYKEMHELKKILKIKMAIFGLLPGLYKVMAASDMVVAKSGGLTTAEALAQGCPMIVTHPIPGQETRNCQVLVTAKAAIRANNLDEVKGIITRLVKNPEELATLRSGISELARPDSANGVVKLIM